MCTKYQINHKIVISLNMSLIPNCSHSALTASTLRCFVLGYIFLFLVQKKAYDYLLQYSNYRSIKQAYKMKIFQAKMCGHMGAEQPYLPLLFVRFFIPPLSPLYDVIDYTNHICMYTVFTVVLFSRWLKLNQDCKRTETGQIVLCA